MYFVPVKRKRQNARRKRIIATLKKQKMLKLGIEPKTFALLARRSNQLSYSSTERGGLLGLLSLPVGKKWSEDTPLELKIPMREDKKKQYQQTTQSSLIRSTLANSSYLITSVYPSLRKRASISSSGITSPRWDRIWRRSDTSTVPSWFLSNILNTWTMLS